MFSDPLADMLTRIRNANLARQEKVEFPASKLKERVCQVLKEEGFIKNFRRVDNRKQGVLRVYLKYGPNQERVITNLQRVSRVSRRRYAGFNDLPRIQGGLGICVVSTSRGVMTDKRAREAKVGGEILCAVW